MKNKAIYTIMDTDKLGEYIGSNLEFFGLATDSDGVGIPDSVQDATIDVVLASATDGRLANAITEVFSDFYGKAVLDKVYEVIDRFVYDEVNKVISTHRTPCAVPASVTLQRWVHDYAVTVDEVEFDCHYALDGFKLSDLPPYAGWFRDRDWCCHGDELFFESEKIGLVDEWDGPFEFYIDDEDAYEEYMDARVKNEYRCELRD